MLLYQRVCLEIMFKILYLGNDVNIFFRGEGKQEQELTCYFWGSLTQFWKGIAISQDFVWPETSLETT